jgi:hypothetical protein
MNRSQLIEAGAKNTGPRKAGAGPALPGTIAFRPKRAGAPDRGRARFHAGVTGALAGSLWGSRARWCSVQRVTSPRAARAGPAAVAAGACAPRRRPSPRRRDDPATGGGAGRNASSPQRSFTSWPTLSLRAGSLRRRARLELRVVPTRSRERDGRGRGRGAGQGGGVAVVCVAGSTHRRGRGTSRGGSAQRCPPAARSVLGEEGRILGKRAVAARVRPGWTPAREAAPAVGSSTDARLRQEGWACAEGRRRADPSARSLGRLRP